MRDKADTRRIVGVRHLLGLIFLISAAVVFPPVLNGQAEDREQAVKISVDLSAGGLTVATSITEGEILSIEVMGPGSTLVVDEDVSAASFSWVPGAGHPDGLYRYEIQAVDKATGNVISRKAGAFSIRGGEIRAPREISPPGQNRRQGMLHEAVKYLADAMGGIMSFFVPEAEAADLTAESSFPAIFFNDTNDEDCESPTGLPWDWLIWTAGGVDSVDTANYFIIYGRGEAATGNCGNAVQILRLNHDGKGAPDSSRDSLVIDSTGDLRFAEDRMFFDRSASRLGIGTTTPGYTLDAIGDRLRLRSSTAAGAKAIQMRTDGSWIDLQAANSDLLVSTTAAHNIYLSSNRVGVGTSVPFYKFSVSGGNSDRSTLHFTNTGTDVGGWLTSVADNNFFVSSGAMWDTDGWVQKSPDGKAVIAGSGGSGYRIITRQGCAVGAKCTPATRLTVGFDGKLTLGGGAWSDGVSWFNFSSREGKDNIKELKGVEAYEALQGLKPVTFTYKGDGEKVRAGFIAEEVPALVAAKERKGLSAMDIVAVLTKVVKEQEEVIRGQREQIQELRQAMADIYSRLGVLESPVKAVASK